MSKSGHRGGREPRKPPASKILIDGGLSLSQRLSEKHKGRNKRRRGILPPTKPQPAPAAHL